MGAMDQISPHIYIGSIWALSSVRDLAAANITHIVSVVRGTVEDMTSKGDPKNNVAAGFFHQLQIEIDDDDEEDIMRFFPQINAFIEKAVTKNQNCLIHCVAGISRSVTVATAYFLWKKSVEQPGIFANALYDENSQNDDAGEKAAIQYVEAMIQEIKSKRSIANPNPSFCEQLTIYLRCGCPASAQEFVSKKLYRQWVLRKQAEGIPLSGHPPKTLQYLSENGGILRLKSNESSAEKEFAALNNDNQDPSLNESDQEPRHITADEILKKRMQERKLAAENRTERPSLAELSSRILTQQTDNGTQPSDNATNPSQPLKKASLTQLRCKKCRSGLASSQGFMIHSPPSQSSTSTKSLPFQPVSNAVPRSGLFLASSISPQCMHYYMEPASWMRAELDKGEHEGRFVCPNPKCKAKVGTYSWHGDTCSCGKWVTPAIGLSRAKVDEVPIRQAL